MDTYRYVKNAHRIIVGVFALFVITKN